MQGDILRLAAFGDELRETGKIDVAAAQDHADALSRKVVGILADRRRLQATGRLDDHLHPFCGGANIGEVRNMDGGLQVRLARRTRFHFEAWLARP